MTLYAPLQLSAYVEAQASQVGTLAFLTERRHSRLKEMWCAARFGQGYALRYAPCNVEIEEFDEQREYDFHLHALGQRLPFQIAEVLNAGRKRGDEYRSQSIEAVAELHNASQPLDQHFAIARIRDELGAKVRKQYAGASDLHILLYINLHVQSLPWLELQIDLQTTAQTFASVWLLTQDFFSCVHGGNFWQPTNGWLQSENAS